MKTKKLTTLALLTAAALGLFVLEAQIPGVVPIPGIKLGLSNIITVCVAFLFGWKQALAVLLVRIFLGSLLTGQLGAVVYSLSGGLLSLLGVCLLKRCLHTKQLWVAGVIGAMLHNLAQVLTAMVLTQTPSFLVYLPVLLLGGMATGLFTGLCAQFLCLRLNPKE